MNIEFADDSGIIEWEPEIERWLEEATGHKASNCFLSDESGLLDMLESEPTGEYTLDTVPFKDEPQWMEVWDTTPESYARARNVLLRYGVDIDTHSTLLIDLAKSTYGKSA